MNIKLNTTSIIVAVFLLAYGSISYPQDTSPDYRQLMQNGQYKEALNQIEQTLRTVYADRVEDKRIPTDFISVRQTEKNIDLEKLFIQRKAEPFFIEENPELFVLHYNAGICAQELNEHEKSLNHLSQSLRYRTLKPEEDHVVYYQISQTYKEKGDTRAYHAALETAYELQPENYRYSLELGSSLAKTGDKKRAIYHLERYVESMNTTLEDNSIYLTLANLNSEIGKYLETVNYYQKYLSAQPDDHRIHFALGTLCYTRTGNHELALRSFNTALTLLPEDDIYRRAKSLEYSGDIHRSDLNFTEAISYYMRTFNYQEELRKEIAQYESEITELKKKVNSLKASLLKNRNYDAYNDYEYAEEELAKKQLSFRLKQHELEKLNPGKVRWNMADSHEHLGQLKEALSWYRKALDMAYRPREARLKISKLQLIIQRGY
ncbi:MAG: tetratricopeptide repeat protein [Spirochaetota bacterium]